MAFDPLDKKYQKLTSFPPDKTDTWPYPVEQDGWTLAHNGIRMEVEQIIKALEASKRRGAMQQWEVACVKKFWKT